MPGRGRRRRGGGAAHRSAEPDSGSGSGSEPELGLQLGPVRIRTGAGAVLDQEPLRRFWIPNLQMVRYRSPQVPTHVRLTWDVPMIRIPPVLWGVLRVVVGLCLVAMWTCLGNPWIHDVTGYQLCGGGTHAQQLQGRVALAAVALAAAWHLQQHAGPGVGDASGWLNATAPESCPLGPLRLRTWRWSWCANDALPPPRLYN